MRSLYFEGVNRVNWRDIAEPKVQFEHEVVVQTLAASACYVDTMIIGGNSPFEPPFAIGHEAVARVTDMGEQVTGLNIGDVVTVPYHRSCGFCVSCQGRRPLQCDNREVPFIPTYGIPDGSDYGGMYSEKFRVPYASNSLLKIPNTIDPLAAVAVSDTLTDAWSTTVPHIRNKPEAKVLITSNAGYGLYAVQWAISAGASLVTYVDDDPIRNKVARDLGADVVLWEDNIELPPIYDVIVNERQGNQALLLCLKSAAADAVCENVVIYFGEVSIPIETMHYSGVSLRSRFSPVRNYMPEVINALANGQINPRAVESELICLNDVPARFAEPSHKPVVVFDESLLT